MIHTNFHEKETWVGDGYERVKESQVECELPEKLTLVCS